MRWTTSGVAGRGTGTAGGHGGDRGPPTAGHGAGALVRGVRARQVEVPRQADRLRGVLAQRARDGLRLPPGRSGQRSSRASRARSGCRRPRTCASTGSRPSSRPWTRPRLASSSSTPGAWSSRPSCPGRTTSHARTARARAPPTNPGDEATCELRARRLGAGLRGHRVRGTDHRGRPGFRRACAGPPPTTSSAATQKTVQSEYVVNASSAASPAAELPEGPSVGLHTQATPRSGMTARMPPPTPLLAGSPTR